MKEKKELINIYFQWRLHTQKGFPYLVRTFTYNNSGCVALYANLGKVKKRWGMSVKVIIQTGEHVKLRSMLCKAVVQTVLLYGYEIWVVIDAMMMFLEGFHHRLDWSIGVLTAI